MFYIDEQQHKNLPKACVCRTVQTTPPTATTPTPKPTKIKWNSLGAPLLLRRFRKWLKDLLHYGSEAVPRGHALKWNEVRVCVCLPLFWIQPGKMWLPRFAKLKPFEVMTCALHNLALSTPTLNMSSRFNCSIGIVVWVKFSISDCSFCLQAISALAVLSSRICDQTSFASPSTVQGGGHPRHVLRI